MTFARKLRRKSELNSIKERQHLVRKAVGAPTFKGEITFTKSKLTKKR